MSQHALLFTSPQSPKRHVILVQVQLIGFGPEWSTSCGGLVRLPPRTLALSHFSLSASPQLPHHVRRLRASVSRRYPRSRRGQYRGCRHALADALPDHADTGRLYLTVAVHPPLLRGDRNPLRRHRPDRGSIRRQTLPRRVVRRSRSAAPPTSCSSFVHVLIIFSPPGRR